MQIALVAIVLLAGMWFTVLRPKPAAAPAPPAAQQQPVAPGVKGLAGAVDQAKGAAATSDAANAKVQAATGGSSATASKPSATATAKATVSKPATTKASATTAKTTKAPAKAAAPAKPAAKPAAETADPSQALLSFLAKGKTVVLLFHSDGADDAAARKAVHRVALQDKNVVTAYADISKVGSYEAITSGVEVMTAPTILVIGIDKKAAALTGY